MRDITGLSPSHARLRAATRPLHEILDQGLDLSALGSPAAYARFLLINWPIVGIEHALTSAGMVSLLPDWDLRQRHAALADDLTTLCVPLPAIDNPEILPDHATMLGWCYVLEGSRLGARAILRAVQLGLSGESCGATRFLCHGNRQDYWSSFKETLKEIDDDNSAIERACDAACAAFGLILRSSASIDGDRAPPGCVSPLDTAAGLGFSAAMNIAKASFLFEISAGPDQAANTAGLKEKIKLYPAIALGTHPLPDGKKTLTIVGSVPQNQSLLPKTAASGLPGVTFRRQR